ncbi:MAG TPA: adenylate/guanylate cyclase domain-containing protein [Candidatus Binatia bacterium]|nr:adenylate/guanylate cyclase domain-containing protein [Candidatus Binatia bacterium]
MYCQSCGSDNPEGVKFCIECAAPLKNRCPNCGFENLPRAKFCGECAFPLVPQPPVSGSKLQVSSSQPPTSNTQSPITYTPPHLAERIRAEQAVMEARGTPDGERKTITALFADIKGSMDMIEDLDPEEARSLFDPALNLMMEAVHRYEGYVAQSTGDGIFAFFGAPLAHEDHPQRALYAALRMQEEMKKYADKLRLEGKAPIQIRVGVNTGEMVLRSIRKDDLHADYTPIGHSTSLASRMEGLATPGSIVVSEHTYKLTEGYFEFKSLGVARVKGVSEPVHIYEVLGAGPSCTRLQVSAKRGLVQFVGRQNEMAQLRRALELAKESRGQIVAAMGEPGVGKSRLFHEFKLISQTDCLVLETFSVSHGKAYPYLPLIDLLKNYFQITLQDDERKRREKVTGKVLTLDRSLEDTLPYLFILLSVSESTSSLAQMDPQIHKRRTFDAIKRLLVRESLNQPLILIFEDLHWLDAETQAFLVLLGESLATTKILLLVNYRPEYRHEWGNKSFYTQLRLDALGQDDAQALLTTLLGDSPDLQPLKQFIRQKTEGNPFFMEEIVQALQEQEMLPDPRRVGTAHLNVGAYGFGLVPSTGPTLRPTDLHLPATVQAVLASRIDRLPPEEKEFLQTLSVIGKEFPFGLLKQVVNKSEDELQRLLSHLQAAEFIYEQPAFPEVEYTFKHALTQEVAYNSLLMERRKILHERTAQAIEALFHSRLDDHYGALAHHYSRSGNTLKAVEYLSLAGQQAVQRSAYTEAISHLSNASESLKTLLDTPERAQREITLQTTLALALMATQGQAAPEVERAYTRARELCQQLGQTPQLFPTLSGLCGFYLVRGELPTTRELGERLLSLAQCEQDPALLLRAHGVLGFTLYYLGEFASAREHSEQAIALYDSQQHYFSAFNPGVVALSCAALALWHLGYPDQALKRSQEALTLAQELSHPFSLVYALGYAARFHQLRQEGQAVKERIEAALTLATEQGFPSLIVFVTSLKGWVLAEQGRVEEGITQMRQSIAARQAARAGLDRPYSLALLAEAYGKGGQAEEGLTALAEALAQVDKNGERYYEAELYRLKGQLTLQQFQVSGSKFQAQSSPASGVRRPVSEAEECFNKAVEIARKQQAKSLELRAVMSLSRLWQQQGKTAEARQMLAEIYNWFTEGFDTADLKEAKVLLEELEGRTTMASGKKRKSTEKQSRRKK